jgi:hypothetical protein
MAKRKKHSTHKKSRRVSGINSTDLKAVGLAVAGAVIGNKITAMLKTKTGTLATVAPYSGLILGIVLPMVSKSQLVKQVSLGLMVNGSVDALKQLAPNLISGPYRLPVVAGNVSRRINGGAYAPNMVGNGGYSPSRNSAVTDTMKIISGAGIS